MWQTPAAISTDSTTVGTLQQVRRINPTNRFNQRSIANWVDGSGYYDAVDRPTVNTGSTIQFDTIYWRDAKPAQKFANENVFTGVTDQGHSFTQGNGTPMKIKDLFAFRPIIPPTFDGSDTNLMVCFTITTELEVEYEPAMERSNYDQMEFSCTDTNVNTITEVYSGKSNLQSYMANALNEMPLNGNKKTNGVPYVASVATENCVINEQGALAHTQAYHAGNDRMGGTANDTNGAVIFKPGCHPDLS